MKLNSILPILTLMLIGVSGIAQSYRIGHKTVNFYDQARRRTVQTEVYYPAAKAGNDVEIANGEFPVIVLGHGFVMNVNNYANFWNELVPQGYIMLLPRTEGNIWPNHGRFGDDIAFLAAEMQKLNKDQNSDFYQAVMNKTAIMGHSMGGGSAFIAASKSRVATTLVTFAAAETRPSAVSAASRVNIPSLVFSGSNDCVVKPHEQVRMYNALRSSCKAYISITGGGHCYFANKDSKCSMGEFACRPKISRSQQQGVVNDFVSKWLDYTLKSNSSALSNFNNALAKSSKITYMQDCGGYKSAPISSVEVESRMYPNPTSGSLTIETVPGTEIEMVNSAGQPVLNLKTISEQSNIDISTYAPGVYFVNFKNGNGSVMKQLIVK
ncbi:MAG: T9SS type A sorting domain-containing protein [Bacteroidales bacterium]|nr:T9SS type A sorting domain-containing protein [Bacteroidales bacterium]